jgi:hypothetical protein
VCPPNREVTVSAIYRLRRNDELYARLQDIQIIADLLLVPLIDRLPKMPGTVPI